MRETMSARLRREWHEAKDRFAKWIIRKAVQWHDRLNYKAFMAYSWALDEITDYHVLAERSYQNCHVYGTKVEYYDAPEEVSGDERC